MQFFSSIFNASTWLPAPAGHAKVPFIKLAIATDHIPLPVIGHGKSACASRWDALSAMIFQAPAPGLRDLYPELEKNIALLSDRIEAAKDKSVVIVPVDTLKGLRGLQSAPFDAIRAYSTVRSEENVTLAFFTRAAERPSSRFPVQNPDEAVLCLSEFSRKAKSFLEDIVPPRSKSDYEAAAAPWDKGPRHRPF